MKDITPKNVWKRSLAWYETKGGGTRKKDPIGWTQSREVNDAAVREDPHTVFHLCKHKVWEFTKKPVISGEHMKTMNVVTFPDKLYFTDPIRWTTNYGMSDGWTYGRVGSYNAFWDQIRSGKARDSLLKQYKTLKANLKPRILERVPKPVDIRRRTVIQDEGDYVNIDRYMNRDPECWEVTRGVPSRKKAIRLGINFSNSSGQSESSFARVCMATALLYDLYKSAGYSIKLNGICIQTGDSTYSGNGDWTKHCGVRSNKYHLEAFSFPILSYNKVATEEKLLSLSSPGVLRYLEFAWHDTLWPTEEDWGARGVPVKTGITEEMLDALDVEMIISSEEFHERVRDDQFVANMCSTIEKLGGI